MILRSGQSNLVEMALNVWPYFGDMESEQNGKTSVTGTTPRGLWMLGQYFSVQSWRDVLEHTMNTIIELEPDKFGQIVEHFPRFIGWDQKKFRAIRKLKNDAFLEVNLSAKSIQGFCYQVLDVVELTSDDWKVEVV